MALCPLSYGRMVRPAGFEPASSRLEGEVTDIFTTVFARKHNVGERADLHTASFEASDVRPLDDGGASAPPGRNRTVIFAFAK
jgi:hypothetical protein